MGMCTFVNIAFICDHKRFPRSKKDQIDIYIEIVLFANDKARSHLIIGNGKERNRKEESQIMMFDCLMTGLGTRE